MLDSIVYRWRLFHRFVALVGLVLALATWGTTSGLGAEDPPPRLIDQDPFDRVTLDQANGGTVIDTLLLDLPNRQVPATFPESGMLELRRVNEPSVLYTVPWSSIAKIELYEQLVLREAIQLTHADKLIDAYADFDFLHRHYPKLSGLGRATERYLKRDALDAFSARRYDESLSILLSLYDYNAQHAGLAKAVQTVGDRLISHYLSSREYAAARSVLDLLENGFPQLELKTVATWRKKFEEGAARQLATARREIDQGRYDQARQAVRRAAAILPSIVGATEILMELDRLSPRIVVAVTRLGSIQPFSQLADWASARVARILNPAFVELVDFGAEGGVYACRWAKLVADDSGLQFDIQLSEEALQLGIFPEALALRVLNMSEPSSEEYREDFAALFQRVALEDGYRVNIHWLRPHVRPEALLQFPLQGLTKEGMPPGSYRLTSDEKSDELSRYELPEDAPEATGPRTIVEQVYPDESLALAALLRGDVHVIDRVPPWQVDQLKQLDGVVVSPYRLPTIHALLPNYSKALLGRREFRRALCYGIDRQRIVKDLLLGGQDRAGFRVLSGPLPPGIALTDPLGYAYKQQLQPRPYEPRLAAVLAGVARASLAKRGKLKDASEASGPEDSQEADSVPVEPLVLAYPPDAVARIACQAIKLQLDVIGIPIKLQELAPHANAVPADYDLLYAELALWEPLVDARRLLGPAGRAGRCSPSMSLALEDVDLARNWKEARTRLRQVHQVAYYDLPVIPLWQTVNFLAHRKTLHGVGSSPVSLYQNLTSWKKSYEGVGR